MTTLANDFPNGPSYLAHHLETQLLVKAVKKGEGSRGGHIIGHTKSGKPVYAPGRGGHYSHMVSGGTFKDPEEVSKKDAEIVMGHYPGFTAKDHEEAGGILEDPNFHTPASAHFLAAQKLAYGSSNDADQRSINDGFGASALSRHKIESASGPMGRSYHGHLIPDASASAYDGVHASGGHLKAMQAAQDAFPEFKTKDHKTAAAAHEARGQQLVSRAHELKSKWPDSELANSFMAKGRRHLAAANAHAAAANPKKATDHHWQITREKDDDRWH